jgi:hypothetical protein
MQSGLPPENEGAGELTLKLAHAARLARPKQPGTSR